ncbi:electron transfer flavoprotein-ubiquinone oxidoreductase [Zobellella iuensis]|uniref:Electron transfer flavoprotein-ubiquinone oxidoreductase n=1 Tax=Zobellella iuensis TaxID=2803811 RepID=A0ABS1QPB5_9GAMM|nr:electron transfer flavoprotein-ubiquinone oxidoreductase [Zobellella iuensis]MBL1376680.1 electron transfer flavoprotein-ubiquinone oxidoreductase [Zobellella iuensis]
MERESMEFDVVIVGAGPAGLSAACRLMQEAASRNLSLNVCLVEKGAEVGAHILSGALLETRALDELFPDWRARGAPVHTPVTEDRFYMLSSERGGLELPPALVPSPLHNEGNYIISLGNLCRWLATQAEQLGVAVFPGFAAQAPLYDDQGRVTGVLTGDMGLAADGSPKANHVPGLELRARYTLFAEGCRGHIGKELIARFGLDQGRDPQHYAIGIKELWQLAPERHRPGLVLHGAGWPLEEDSGGGFFLYHGDDGQAAVGLIVDLNYRNPHLSPFDEFQRLKHHPLLARHLYDGKRLAYGARAITKGGLNSLPRMTMPGALLLGCDAGTLNGAKIKGIHTAMKSGMLAAETVVQALAAGDQGGNSLTAFDNALRSSWLHQELHQSRNFVPALHRLGPWLGGAFNTLNHNGLGGRLPFTLHDRTPDHATLAPAAKSRKPDYPKPDGQLSFDRLSSVYLANTGHDEDQPCHLQLLDPEIPLRDNLPRYQEPAQRYCPAGVYEVVEQEGESRFQINAANCVHCKTCDIKDPAQNIRWVPPEGGSGPNYPNM